MKKNEEYIVTCIDDTDLNSGVVKIDDMVVFVPNLLIGEKAKIKIVKVNKKYAFGIITQLLEPSINRQELTCEVAKTCGGCQLQHMKYAYQLDYKYKHVKKLFEDIEVKPILGMDSPWYYRNKAQFPVKINLIEYNNVEGSGFSHSPEKNRDEFVKFLESCNMIVNIRHSKGKDIDAACGQLAGKTKRNA